MAAALEAENHGDEWGLTWYLRSGIYTSIPTWTRSQNSLAAAALSYPPMKHLSNDLVYFQIFKLPLWGMLLHRHASKNSTTHMHGLVVYVKEGLPLHGTYLSKTQQILTYVFDWLYFTQCLTCFSSINHFLCVYAWFLILFHLTWMRFSQSTYLVLCLFFFNLTMRCPVSLHSLWLFSCCLGLASWFWEIFHEGYL